MPELARKYSLTWHVTPDLLGILSDAGHFENTNPAWFTTLGLKPDEIERRDFFDFIHPDDIDRTKTAFERIRQGEPILGFENRYRHKDGSYRWLSWNAVPESGRYYCSARDITDHKEAIAALIDSERDARLREQFIAVLGHDLRNPLAAISSATRMIRRETQSETTLKLLDITDGSVDRMAALIKNLMDFAKARLGGGIAVERSQAAQLIPVIEQAVTEIELGHPDIQIERHLDFEDPVDCDAVRIAQLLSNLLSNAVVHGDAGHPIRVIATVSNGLFSLSVANVGRPIPKSTLQMLFQPFFRARADDHQQGLGLGLYIAMEIARAHGGTLTATSDEELTVFTFEMPRN